MTYIGIILAAIFGLLFGNYATTAFHRLPLGKPINGLSRTIGIKPHCSTCNHELKFYEYLPLLSWFSTRFTCNYCGAKTDMTYFCLEFGSMCIAVILFLTIGFTDYYIIFLLASVVLLLNALLLYKHKKLFILPQVWLLILAGVYYVA
ncbi:MAG: prepilin peptidase [Rickettsiales bacterium]